MIVEISRAGDITRGPIGQHLDEVISARTSGTRSPRDQRFCSPTKAEPCHFTVKVRLDQASKNIELE